MMNEERAKQFMPFAALKGFEDAIKETEFVPEERILLGEDAQEELDIKLRELSIGDTVTVVYYKNKQYVQLTGPLTGIDLLHNTLHIRDTIVPIHDLYNLKRQPLIVPPFVHKN